MKRILATLLAISMILVLAAPAFAAPVATATAEDIYKKVETEIAINTSNYGGFWGASSSDYTWGDNSVTAITGQVSFKSPVDLSEAGTIVLHYKGTAALDARIWFVGDGGSGYSNGTSTHLGIGSGEFDYLIELTATDTDVTSADTIVFRSASGQSALDLTLTYLGIFEGTMEEYEAALEYASSVQPDEDDTGDDATNNEVIIDGNTYTETVIYDTDVSVDATAWSWNTPISYNTTPSIGEVVAALQEENAYIKIVASNTSSKVMLQSEAGTAGLNAPTFTTTDGDNIIAYYLGTALIEAYIAETGAAIENGFWNLVIQPTSDITISVLDIVKLIEVSTDYESDSNTVTVYFDANGGSGTMESLTLTKGDYFYPYGVVCEFTPPEGYIFLSWNVTDADGNYVNPFGQNISEDLYMSAGWTPKLIGSIRANVEFPITGLRTSAVKTTFNNSYQSAAFTWEILEGDTWVAFDGVFEEGNTYRVSVELVPINGAYFDDVSVYTNVTVYDSNRGSWEAGASVIADEVYADGDNIIIVKEFTPIVKNIVSTLQFSEFTLPEYGTTIGEWLPSVADGLGYYISSAAVYTMPKDGTSWTICTAEDIYTSDNYYYYQVYLSADDMYCFNNTDVLDVSINGVSSGVNTSYGYNWPSSRYNLTANITIDGVSNAASSPILASGTWGDNITWTVTSDGVLTISGKGDMTDIDGFIPYGHLSEYITKAVVEDGVTSIGEYAFYLEKLTEVTIAESVTTIEFGAFANASSLTSITIPAAVTSIGENAFVCCTSLESINVSEESTSYSDIDGVLFNKDATTLLYYPAGKTEATYTIPDTVTQIGWVAFAGSTSLETVEVPDSVTYIDTSAFITAHKLTNIYVSDNNAAYADVNGVLLSKNLTSLLSYPYGRTAYTYAIPETVTYISSYAFWNNESITNLVIPKNVTYVDWAAFGGCASLQKLVFLSPDTEISSEYETIAETTVIHGYEGSTAQAYAEQFGRTFVSLDETPITTLANGTCGDSLTWKLTSDGVLTISGEGEMYDYDWNTSPWYSYRYDILSVIIEDGVTSIGYSAFFDCASLASIIIPDSVTSIGGGAFQYCSSLISITIPDSVTSIGWGAFWHCSSLTSINVSDENVYYADIDGVLFNKSCTELICYPEGKTDTSYMIPNSVTSIGDYAFSYCSSLISISIGNGVTRIGNWAFSYCFNLTSVTIPDSVTSIGDSAFTGCSSLTSVTIPNSVTYIGEIAFGRCSSLTSINVSGENLYYADIDGVLFNKSCTELICYPEGKTDTSYMIPDGVTSIGNYSFWGCSSLTSVTIPDSVTSIGLGAFYACPSLTSITIPDSVTSIGNYSFWSCSSLESITFMSPDTVIHGDEDTISDTATIYGYEGSTAQAYAEKYGRNFVAIDREPDPLPDQDKTGNLNGDDKLDNKDALHLLYHTMFPEDYPVTEECDYNNDGSVDRNDALYLLYHVIFGAEMYPLK